jgi:hypothetical protein
LEPDHEGREDERQQHHQVALLEAVRAVGRVDRGLREEADQEADGERGVPGLLPRERLPEREHQADDRSGHEREARGVGEQHRVGADPVQDLARVDVHVGDVRVVAEQPLRARHRCDGERRRVKQHR